MELGIEGKSALIMGSSQGPSRHSEVLKVAARLTANHGVTAGDGVTVNMILPGKIDTERVGQLDTARAGREDKTLEEVRTQIAASLLAKRYGQPEEFANVATLLMRAPANYVTGQMTRVDGGMIAST